MNSHSFYGGESMSYLKCSWGGDATSERVLREHEGLYKSVAYWVALDSDRVSVREW